MANRTLRIAQFANVVLFALVMGVFWGTWFSLSRSIASITPESFLEIGHLMIANLGRPMSVLMPAALISSVIVLALLARQTRGSPIYLALAALLLMVASARGDAHRQRPHRRRNQPMDHEYSAAGLDGHAGSMAVLSHCPHVRLYRRPRVRDCQRITLGAMAAPATTT